MSLALALSVRNDRLDRIRAAIDRGTQAGRLTLFAGPQPSLGGAGGQVLAQLTFARPCAEPAANGELVFLPINPVTADATGTATWARATDSAGGLVFDCDVGAEDDEDSDAAITLNRVDLVLGGQVTVTSARLFEGNAPSEE